MKRLLSIALLLALPALADVQTTPGRQVRMETNAWVSLKETHVGIYAPSNPVPAVNNNQYIMNWIDSQWASLATITYVQAATNAIWQQAAPNVLWQAATNALWQAHIADRFDGAGVLRNTNILTYFPYLDTDYRDDVTNIVGGGGITVTWSGKTATIINPGSGDASVSNYSYDAQCLVEASSSSDQPFLTHNTSWNSPTYETLYFATETRDPKGAFDGITGTFVPPTNGVYMITAATSGYILWTGTLDTIIKMHLFDGAGLIMAGSTSSKTSIADIYPGLSANVAFVGYLTTASAVTVRLTVTDDNLTYYSAVSGGSWFKAKLIHQVTF